MGKLYRGSSWMEQAMHVCTHDYAREPLVFQGFDNRVLDSGFRLARGAW
jgi:hypothetical protein